MQHDRKITISAGNNRRAMSWQPLTMMLSELWARLQTPARGTETLAEYLNMKKVQQDDLKDVGGFMAGTLNGPRRKANNVTGRDLITLDLDNIPAGGTENVLRRVEGLGCGYCVYSTRKHSPAGRVCVSCCPLTARPPLTNMSRWHARWLNTSALICVTRQRLKCRA